METNPKNFSQNIYLYGSESSLPPRHFLTAGPLKMLYESGNLRHIKLGNTELVRMIYAALRDQNWGTLIPQISNEQIAANGQSFSITYDCTYKEGNINFFAHYSITGDENGKIVFSMKGEALSSFKKNRLGFCILHPASAAEMLCRYTTANGEEKRGKFPKYISPHQPFVDLKKFAWHLGDHTTALLEFEGDIFEMEDQRNWTDASYKTYCTPLSLPFPVQMQKGDQVRQKVTLSLLGKWPAAAAPDNSLAFIIPEKAGPTMPLPALGVSRSAETGALGEDEIALLKKAGFSHYRADLKLANNNWQEAFLQAIKETRKLEIHLELALHFKNDAAQEVNDFLAVYAQHQPAIKYLLLFHDEAKFTPDHLIKTVLPVLRNKLPGTAIGAGTHHFFTELNRNRPLTDGLDFLTYSVNPQVHQFDNLTMAENVAAQQATVESARQFANGLSIHVSPVTLKMRANPNATGAKAEDKAKDLPPGADVRQMSLFGAVWTLGSLKYLSEVGAEVVTYFETVGMRGLMQGSEPPSAKDFKAVAHQVFPLYFVFRELTKYPEAKVIPAYSTHPLEADGLLLQTNHERILLLGNMQPEAKEITIRNIGEKAEIKVLDEENVAEAVLKPEVFTEADFTALDIDNQEVIIRLKAYALAVIRWEN